MVQRPRQVTDLGGLVLVGKMNTEVARGHFFGRCGQLRQRRDQPAPDEHQQHAPKQQQIADQQDQRACRCPGGAARQNLHIVTQALTKMGAQQFKVLQLCGHDASEFQVGDERGGGGQVLALYRLHNARCQSNIVAIACLELL